MVRRRGWPSAAGARWLAAVVSIASLILPARAQEVWDVGAVADPAHAKNDFWAGADITRGSWSVFAGSTYAPFGALRDDGLRVRATTAYGRYRYEGYERVAGKLRAKTIHGQVSFTDAMLGYQVKLGALTLKAFAGAAVDTHAIDTLDLSYEPAGRAWGGKAALETWLDIGRIGYAQLDASWTSAHAAYSARTRLGYRILPDLSAGIEAGVMGNVEHGSGRGGGFLRYEWAWGEASAAGGMTGTLEAPASPYATINVLVRY